MKNRKLRAFSYVEISVVILIVGFLLAAISKGTDMVYDFKLQTARSVTAGSPLGRIPDLVLWLDAISEEGFDSSLMREGDKVDLWQDTNMQSQNKDHALQATALNQPIYEEKGINGLPALGFNGTNSYLEIPYSEKLNPDNFTFFLVVKPTIVDDTYRSIITSRDVSPTRGYLMYIADNSKYSPWVGRPHNAWMYLIYPDVVKAGKSSILATTYNGDSFKGYEDGYFAHSQSSTFGRNTSKPFRIGAGSTENVTPSYYYGGYIGEIIVFARALKEGERKSVEKYLSQKWKIDLVE